MSCVERVAWRDGGGNGGLHPGRAANEAASRRQGA